MASSACPLGAERVNNLGGDRRIEPSALGQLFDIIAGSLGWGSAMTAPACVNGAAWLHESQTIPWPRAGVTWSGGNRPGGLSQCPQLVSITQSLHAIRPFIAGRRRAHSPSNR